MVHANPISQANGPHESLLHKQRDTHAQSLTCLEHRAHQGCIYGNDSFYLSNTPDAMNDVLMLKLQGVHGLRMAKMESVRGLHSSLILVLFCSSSIMSHQLLLTT